MLGRAAGRLRSPKGLLSHCLFAPLLVPLLLCTVPLSHASAPMHVERFGAPSPWTIIFLHGASGPDRYRDFAAKLAKSGFLVLMPHFFDASPSSSQREASYPAWATAVRELAHQQSLQQPSAHIALVGISLGASVALAAGTERGTADAVVDWSGSLPDDFVPGAGGLPPLLILHGQQDADVPVENARQLLRLCSLIHLKCNSQIYPSEAHVFGAAAAADAGKRIIHFLDQLAPVTTSGSSPAPSSP